MNYREYEEFKNQITSEKLKENIEIVVLLVVIGTLSGIILQMLGINF